MHDPSQRVTFSLTPFPDSHTRQMAMNHFLSGRRLRRMIVPAVSPAGLFECGGCRGEGCKAHDAA